MTVPITVRVYGILVHQQRLLLSRENVKGTIITKFPGGGLEPKEGLLDCLKREFREEVSINLNRTERFYTTEDYFPSQFHADQRQVLSIYYRVWTDQVEEISTGNPNDNSLLQKDDDQVLYWLPISELKDEPIPLPIDRIVVGKLLEQFS